MSDFNKKAEQDKNLTPAEVSMIVSIGTFVVDSFVKLWNTLAKKKNKDSDCNERAKGEHRSCVEFPCKHMIRQDGGDSEKWVPCWELNLCQALYGKE